VCWSATSAVIIFVVEAIARRSSARLLTTMSPVEGSTRIAAAADRSDGRLAASCALAGDVAHSAHTSVVSVARNTTLTARAGVLIGAV